MSTSKPSVPGSAAVPATLTAASSLYATLTYWGGGMPGVDGRELIRKHLEALQPDSPAATIEMAVNQATTRFNALGTDSARLRHAGHAAALLKTSMGSEAMRKVLPALWTIAGADMHINDFERQFIMDSAAYFGAEASTTSPDTIYSFPHESAKRHADAVKPQLSWKASAPTKPNVEPPPSTDPARFRTAYISEEDMFRVADAAVQRDSPPADLHPSAPPAESVAHPHAEAERTEPSGAPRSSAAPAEQTQFISEQETFEVADTPAVPAMSPLKTESHAAPPEPPPHRCTIRAGLPRSARRQR